jgi:N-acetyl-1-D-myo-inositol-2-amino-2-deoxy-alpha-D-glucopyranoside deacetylase
VAWRAFQLAGDPGLSMPGLPGPDLPGPGLPGPGLPGPGLPGPDLAGPGLPGPDLPAAAAEGDPWRVAKFYATAVPRSVLAAATDLSGRVGEAAPAEFIAEPAADTVPYGAADDQVSTEIDGSAYLAAKTAAMRAHATQITVREPFFALSNWVGQRILAREYYTLLAAPRDPSAPDAPDAPDARHGPDGRETDLFAGLD